MAQIRRDVRRRAWRCSGYARGSLPILFVRARRLRRAGALFGPIKYGILPDHLAREELPAGNALVEGATFIAILTGTIVGGLAARGGGSVAAFAALVMGFALACWLAALLIPPTGEGAPQLKISVNIAASTVRDDPPSARRCAAVVGRHGDELVLAGRHRGAVAAAAADQDADRRQRGHRHRLSRAVLDRGRRRLGLAAAIARGRIVLKTTLAGAVLLGAFALDLGIATYGAAPALAPQAPGAVFSSVLGIRVAIDLAGLAIAGGLFIVPAFAAVQAWAGADYRARTVAAVNVLNAAFMTGATVAVAIMQKYGVTVPALFLMIGVATLLVALAIWRTMPKAGPDCLLPHLQHAIDHLAGDAEIIGRVHHLLQLLAAGVLADLLVLGEQIDQRAAGLHHLAADVVDHVVRAVAPHRGAQPHHHRFRHDQALGDVEVLAHLLFVDLQAARPGSASAPARRPTA